MKRRSHARPYRAPNPWIGLVGLIGYAVPTAVFLWALAVLLLAMGPAVVP